MGLAHLGRFLDSSNRRHSRITSVAFLLSRTVVLGRIQPSPWSDRGSIPTHPIQSYCPMGSKLMEHSSMDSAGWGKRNSCTTFDMVASYYWYHDDQSPRHFRSKPRLSTYRFSVLWFTECFNISMYRIPRDMGRRLSHPINHCYCYAVHAIWQSRYYFFSQ